MALIGTIEPFSLKSDFTSYVERLEHLFKVNKTDGALKLSMLITFGGPDLFNIMKSLTSPKKPEESSFEEIVSLLKKHFDPAKLEIAETFNFNNCVQKPNQSVADYVVELKELARTCNFGGFLGRALRDRLVCGLRSESIQKRLLSESNLTIDKAVSIATNCELAESQVKAFQPDCGLNKVQNHKKSSASSKSSVNKPSNSNSSGGSVSKSRSCFRCGRNHNPATCPAEEWTCYSCRKKGHTSSVCKQKGKVNKMEEQEQSMSDDNNYPDEEEYLAHLSCNKLNFSEKAGMSVNGQFLQMEVDSGAARSVISEIQFKEMFPKAPILPVTVDLSVITGQTVTVIGESRVEVQFNKICKMLPLLVIESLTKFTPLMGRDWLDILCPKWRENLLSQNSLVVNVINESELREQVKSKFSSVFSQNESSAIKEFSVSLELKDGVTPIFHKPYSLPYALREKVENKIKSMVKSNILIPVTQSNWASPIVVVPKKNNDIRICVDFKVSLNKVLNPDYYPLPNINDILSCMSGGKIFCVLDLSGTYQQLLVDSKSQDYLTINTHIGLFKYTRLTYGITSAPCLFQLIMDKILNNLKDVVCYLDDILIKGEDLESCKENLYKVLERLSNYNVKVNLSKCKLFETEVDYLGHRVDKDGLHPSSEKVEAIVNAPEPTNITQLRSYLGLLNFYSKFLPMLSSEVKPLYKLQEKNVPFIWSEECSKAFTKSKELLLNNQLLVHFDPAKLIVVACDASAYGVGAVLSHRINGVDRPVLFASSTLSPSEKNYSNLEREALAIIFAIKRFHKYLYGQNFVLLTDHQPLQTIFNPNKALPSMSVARLVRWAIFLSAYKYTIEYRKGKSMGNADALSRLPLTSKSNVLYVNSFNNSDSLPLTFETIAKYSKKDVVLSKIIDLTMIGWPNSVEDLNFKPYFNRRLELTVESGCLIWGNCVVIPLCLREQILEMLHENHLGIVRSKMLARSSIWWPNISQDIETFIGKCATCQLTQNSNADTSLLSWPKSNTFWSRVHVDFFHKNNQNFLIIIDSYSKWIDVHIMNNSTNASHTIDKLKQTFAIFGIPNSIVSDNGPPFNSDEFISFCQKNGINPIKSPPYHPQSNGLAERGVQTVKKSLVRLLLEEEKNKSSMSMSQKLSHFLFTYRNTPTTVTGLTPAEMIFKNKPKTRLDLLKPVFGQNNSHYRQSKTFVAPKLLTYSVNEKVLIKTRDKDTKWVIGEVVKVISVNTYLAKVNNIIKFVHVDHMRKCNPQLQYKMPIPTSTMPPPVEIEVPEPNASSGELIPGSSPPSAVQLGTIPKPSPKPSVASPILRRSARSIKPPVRLDI